MADINAIEKKLQSYRKDADTLKTELAKQQGIRQSLMDRLKKEYGITSIEQVEKKLADLNKQKKTINADIELLVNKIDKKYGEIFNDD
jgi:hypothetical protein